MREHELNAESMPCNVMHLSGTQHAHIQDPIHSIKGPTCVSLMQPIRSPHSLGTAVLAGFHMQLFEVPLVVN